MKINKKILSIGIIVLILIINFSILLLREENNTVSTNTQVLSNKKIEWGIKREDNHKQPDVGTENKKILEEYNGISIGNNQDKYIYLTFDEGYEAGYTEKILEILKENSVNATFFITAHYVNTNDELVKKMIENGNIVGNHTVNHKSMPSLSENELKDEVMKLHNTMLEKFKYEMKYLRPPKGEFSQKSLAITSELGYTNVMWSFAYEDWNENNQLENTKAKEKIINNLHNGEIMLLHGNSKTNTDILSDVIKEAKNMGYEFKSLDEFKK